MNLTVEKYSTNKKWDTIYYIYYKFMGKEKNKLSKKQGDHFHKAQGVWPFGMLSFFMFDYA